MKRFKFYVYFITFLSALLLSNYANAKAELVFDRDVYDFGDFLITDGPVSCFFEYTNVGDQPAVIHNVVSSCGCKIGRASCRERV